MSDQAEFYEYNGYEFSKDIIQVVNGYQNHDTDLSNNIDILPLNVQPCSAVEYCYNKNKRDSEGHVFTGTNTTNLKWYLPAVDEIEDIVMSSYVNNGIQNNTYGRFPEFQEKYYWSSQPAYIRNYAQAKVWMLFTVTYRGAYYYDDVQYARTTRVTRTNNQYEYERSGVTSYYNAVLIDESQNSTIQTEGTVSIGNKIALSWVK